MSKNNHRFGVNVEYRFARVRHYASDYQPRYVDGYTIHNPFFTPLVQINIPDISSTFHFLSEKNTFQFNSHPQTGLVRTSDTVQTHMHRQWITDSVMVGYWQRRADPLGWQLSMLTQAAVMASTDVEWAVEKAEADPNWYRHGAITHGVFHLYQPGSIELDAQGLVLPDSVQQDPDWHNRKRLESQAQLLLWLVKTWLADTAPWGFNAAMRQGKPALFIQTAIERLTRYLLAVTTDPRTGQPDFHTPSASSWEEYPFAAGMTSDAGFIVLALQAVLQLNQPDWLLPSKLRLMNTIIEGQDYINQRIILPLLAQQPPMQTPLRPADMSLTLLAASGYRFSLDDVVFDAQIRLNLIKYCLKTLSGANGLRRFNEYTLDGVTLHDNYLNYAANFPREWYSELLGVTLDSDSYFTAGDDTSSPEALLSRQKTSRYEYSAQWGLGLSASLQALIQCKRDLLAAPENALHPIVDDLIRDVYNRCIAAIPASRHDTEPILRADGSPCPEYAAMEAYQVVPDLAGRAVWLPGAHTLPWHAAQLYDGLIQLIDIWDS